MNKGSNTKTIPVRAPIPEYMVDMSDNDFGSKFFSQIDLDHPTMVHIKTLVEKENYTTALEEWSNVFWDRATSISDPSKYTRASWYVYNADDLMLPDTVKFQHEKLIADYGLPFSRKSAADMATKSGNASMEWQRPDIFSCYLNTLAHPRVLIHKVQDIKVGIKCPYTVEAYLKRWSDIVRDFVNNNWNCGIRLHNSQSLTDETLVYYKCSSPPSEWGRKTGSFMYYHIYGLHVLLESWIESVRHLAAHANLEAKTYIPYRTTTEMCYFIMVWPGKNAADNNPNNGCMAQRTIVARDLFELCLLMPEFLLTKTIETYPNTVFCSLTDITAQSISSDFNRDGSGTENSYNYMFLTHRTLKTLLSLCIDAKVTLPWKKAIESLISRRDNFRDNLNTNLGAQVLCKGTYQDNYHSPDGGLSKTSPTRAYTSIAFPWHGLYMMRDGFAPRDFFISLHSPLRGSGHEANDANKIMLEAFGRYMLVANSGEDNKWGTSWMQNTVQVDDQPQAKVSYPRHAAWVNPQSGLWHIGQDFDMAETKYTYGYGPQTSPLPPAGITNVIHIRKLIHIKNFQIALVVDKMETSDDQNHKYTQTWHFHKDFPETNVLLDSNNKTIITNQSEAANISMLQVSQETLNYTKYYGEGYTGPIPANLNQIGTTDNNFRGWFNNGDGYGFKNNVYPAVDIHISFNGHAVQKVITALVPSPDIRSRVLSSKRIETDTLIGIELVLIDNTEICIYEAIRENISFSFPKVNAEMLILLKKPDQSLWTGLYQNAHNTRINHAEFEILPGNVALPIFHLRTPDWFNWETNNSGHEVPIYFQATIQPEGGLRKINAGESITLKAITPSDYASSNDYQWKVNGINVGNNIDSYSYTTQPDDLIECAITATSFTGDSLQILNTNVLCVSGLAVTS